MAISYGHLHEPFTASRQFASIIPSDYVDIHDDGTSNKVPPILLNSTEKKAFDDDYEPCMKHMQRGWIKQVQYEDLNMRQANMLFKSARNCFSEAQRPFARVCKSLAATPFSCQVSTL
jgi:hypothetical protein